MPGQRRDALGTLGKEHWAVPATSEGAPAGRRTRALPQARRRLTSRRHVVEQEQRHGRAEAQQGAHEQRRHALLHRAPRIVGQPAGQAWQRGGGVGQRGWEARQQTGVKRRGCTSACKGLCCSRLQPALGCKRGSTPQGSSVVG